MRVPAAVLPTLLLAAAAEAQMASPTGTVHDTALDGQGRPFAGAAATLVGPFNEVAETLSARTFRGGVRISF